MHGMILSELRKFVVAAHGEATWKALLEQAGYPGKSYVPLTTYPDEEVVALVTTASRMTGKPVPVILEEFGEAIAPSLLSMYKSMVSREWGALDLLENTESTMHKVVRMRNPGAEPPRLQITRVGPKEVKIIYTSQRRLCGVAKGIIRGIAKHYDERLQIQEPRCMHRGDPQCEIRVTA